MINQIDRDKIDFMNQPNQPKSLESQSEIKSPTINSSLVQNFRSYHDLASPYPISKLHSLCHIDDHSNCMINGIHKQNYMKQQTILSPKQKHRQVKNLVLKFIQVLPSHFTLNILLNKLVILKEQAYIYKETLFNTFQKTLIKEKYLQADNQEFTYQQFTIYRVIWDLLYFLLISFLHIQLPQQMGFELQKSQFEGFIIIPIIILDIVINYYESKKQESNFNLKKLNKHDIVYLISYSLIQGTNTFSSEIVISCYILSFFCGLIKVQQLIEKNKFYFSLNLSPWINMFIFIMTIHFSACIWLYLGIEDNSWLSDYNLRERDNITKYCYALYWSAATLLNVGQSQINATTTTELLYSTFIMCLSGFVLAYLFNFTHEILKEKNKKEAEQIKQLRTINKFLDTRNFPVKIKSRIRNYIFNNCQQNQQNQAQNYLSQLPKNIGEQLQLQMKKEALQKCKFFKNFSVISRNKLLSLMEYQIYATNDIITQATLNIVEFGKVDVYEQDQYIHSLKSGDYFGEFNFITGQMSSTQFKIVEATSVYQIQYTNFIKVISQNKYDYEKFMFIKDSLFNKKYRVIHLKCSSCQSYSHLIHDCPIINYKPNLLRLISKQSKAHQKRTNFVRNQNINHRLYNQTFKNLSTNLSCIETLQIKMKFIYPESSEEHQEEEEANQILDQLNEQMQSNLSNSRVLKECPTDQIIDQNENHIKYISIQGTNGTAQFQHDQQQYQFLAPQTQKKYIYGTSLKPFDRVKSGNSLTQLEQISQSCLSNEGLSQRKQINKHSKGRIKQKQADDSPEQFLPKIKEVDSCIDSQHKNEELLIPKFEKYSLNSLKSKNTLTNQQSRQSSRKFSSKLSTIQQCSSELVNLPKTKQSQFAKNQLQQMPIAKEIVDLSLYHDEPEEEFEKMHIFTIYYPSWNYNEIIEKLQKYTN